MMNDEDILKKLEDSTKNATRHQLETLQSILERQSGVRYLQPYLSGCCAPIDAATYKRAVPLSCYDDYADHINQLADGDHGQNDQPLLSVDPLVCFFYSSGTSSKKPKLIPYFDSALSKAASQIAHQGSIAILRRLFPPKHDVNKILFFIYSDNKTTTKAGFKVMAASAFPLQGLIGAFSFFESKWEQLCDDLENGYPCLDITEVAMRDSVIEVLGGPQPDLSKRIRSICGESNWSGIFSKLWPNVRYIKCVTTGSMRQYCSKIKYYAGEVPVLGGDYFASECYVGVNLDIAQPPQTTRFLMLPTAAYFEFLPFDMEKNEAVGEETVDFSGVEIGKMYEVVVTTYRGFYRYRLGDIVKVVDFYNSSPRVEFVMRAPKSSFEIISERDLMSAMESFQMMLRNVMAVEIVEFAGYTNLESSPKKLMIFVEIREGCTKLRDSVAILRRCCSSLEDAFGSVYKVQRDRGEISPLSVSIVKPGTFDRLLQVAIEKGAPASQYKPPKIVRNREIVEFMEGCSLVTVRLDSLDG
ncbi:hypothetical protein AB3S75_021967 [Citrus x aurantiifolia]